jgi:hypothetical protein
MRCWTIAPKRELVERGWVDQTKQLPSELRRSLTETRADPVGPDLFWGHPHITDRRGSSFWRSASSIARAHRLDDAAGNGGNVGDGGELWAHGHSVSPTASHANPAYFVDVCKLINDTRS